MWKIITNMLTRGEDKDIRAFTSKKWWEKINIEGGLPFHCTGGIPEGALQEDIDELLFRIAKRYEVDVSASPHSDRIFFITPRPTYSPPKVVGKLYKEGICVESNPNEWGWLYTKDAKRIKGYNNRYLQEPLWSLLQTIVKTPSRFKVNVANVRMGDSSETRYELRDTQEGEIFWIHTRFGERYMDNKRSYGVVLGDRTPNLDGFKDESLEYMVTTLRNHYEGRGNKLKAILAERSKRRLMGMYYNEEFHTKEEGETYEN